MESDLKILLKINDKTIAEDIQRILEDSGIYSILESDNPASSLLNIYSGLNVTENITLIVNKNDFSQAIEVLRNTQYNDLLPIP